MLLSHSSLPFGERSWCFWSRSASACDWENPQEMDGRITRHVYIHPNNTKDGIPQKMVLRKRWPRFWISPFLVSMLHFWGVVLLTLLLRWGDGIPNIIFQVLLLFLRGRLKASYVTSAHKHKQHIFLFFFEWRGSKKVSSNAKKHSDWLLREQYQKQWSFYYQPKQRTFIRGNPSNWPIHLFASSLIPSKMGPKFHDEKTPAPKKQKKNFQGTITSPIQKSYFWSRWCSIFPFGGNMDSFPRD